LKRIQNIQALRGIAVISVILAHLIIAEMKFGGSGKLLSYIYPFRFFGVDMFFVISGFLMIAITRSKPEGPSRAFRFLYGRVSRIYPLYWIFTAAVFAVFFIRPEWVNSYQGNRVNVLSSFLLIPEETLPMLIVAWTLIHEMYFYIMFFLFLLILKGRYFYLWISAWSIAILVVNLSFDQSIPFIKLISHPLSYEFIAGCLLAKVYFSKDLRFSTKFLVLVPAAVTVLALIGSYSYYFTTGEVEIPSWYRLFIFGIPAFLVVSSMIYAEKNGFLLHRSLMFTGNFSYSIYLTHVLTISAIARIWSFFASDGIIDNIIMIPVIFGLTLFAGYLSYRIFEKPLMVLSKKFAR